MKLGATVLVFGGAILASAFSRAQTSIEIPGGSAGIGFDDLRFAPASGSVLVPAGRTGVLALVDPATRGVTVITGFSATRDFSGGHDDGVTSADEGRGWIFATDRTSGVLDIVDPRSRRIASSARLAGPPDYVRFVQTTGEVWVTQPDRERIEIFRLSAGSPPAAAHEAFLPVPGGPESLVVDGKRGRAYTHLWKGKTAAIDVKARAVVATWENGCTGSRGIALDEPGRFLFAGCAEGKAVVLDAGSGKVVSSLATGNGVDIIDYDATLAHLYLPGGRSATMAVLGVSREGKLSMLGTLPTPPRGALRRERQRKCFRLRSEERPVGCLSRHLSGFPLAGLDAAARRGRKRASAVLRGPHDGRRLGRMTAWHLSNRGAPFRGRSSRASALSTARTRAVWRSG